MRLMLCVFVFFTLTSHAELSADQNWPQWRGPDGTGVATAGSYPVQFSNSENVAWSKELPGRGSSTPAVWGESIFVTCEADGQDTIVCYDWNGEVRWQKQLGPGREGKHRNGSGSNPSPVTDGKHVVVYYKSGNVACFDFAGEKLWQHNLQEEYAEDTLWWDLGTSPVLVDGKAVIAVMQQEESYLVAYDVATGDVVWREERNYNVNTESNHAYTTPNVVEVNGEKQIVAWGADHLSGHSVADGKRLWHYSGFNPEDSKVWRTIASATSAEGVAIVPYGRGDLVAAVEMGKSGDVNNASDVLWTKQGSGAGADVPSPIIRNGRAYLLTDAGRIDCYDLKSGDVLWSTDLPRARAKFYASPILAGELFYCAREDGVVFVGKVSESGFELLAENNMQERIIATPIPINGNILIRGEQHLILIGD